MNKSKKRILLLDKLRGIAVFFMILAHSVVFFNFNSNNTLDLLSRFGDTIAFTFFLFVSSAVGYLSYVHTRKHNRTLRERTVKRIGLLLLGYYVIGAVVCARTLYYLPLAEKAEKIFRVILFIDLPSYSEFLFPFIFYGIVTYLFRKQIKGMLSNSLVTVLIAISLYLFGAILHQLDWPSNFAHIISLFVGYKDWFRFPILQYAPVYLLGMLWMRLIVENKFAGRIKYSSIFLYFTLLIFVAGLFINNFVNLYAFEELLTRWPPTPFFILVGLILVLLSSLLVESTKNFTLTALIQWGFNLLGKKAFLYYIVHIVILYLYRYFINEKITNPYYTLGLFVALLLLSVLVAKFIGLIFNKKERDNSRIDDFVWGHKLELFLLVLVSSLSAAFLVLYDGQKVDINDTDPSTIPPIEDNSIPYWWDDTYKANRQISIQAGENELNSDEYISFVIDHKSLVDQGKSRVDGLDLKLLSFAYGEFSELDFTAQGLNTEETTIAFQLQRNIQSNETDSRYFLYYGNSGTFLGFVPDSQPQITDETYQVIIGEEVLADIAVNMSREWILKGKGISAEDKTAAFNIELSNIEPGDGEIVAKLITDKDTVTLETVAVDEDNYKVDINGDSLEPGSYVIQAEVVDTNFRSREVTFYVSYPLYVTWTMDWEGFDVTDQYLNSMSSISTDYGMPITQFFNPRIFVAEEISQSRRQRLVNWVLERQTNNGDEIGLHLHMHYDLIEAIGLDVRTEPKWGGRVNGHDVLTSAYTYDEFYEIISWSKQKFVEYGLPVPESYRAGGWFLDLDNIRALQDQDFLIESSGREYYIWGPNQQQGLWTLTSTTHPYQPSMVNQNTNVPEPVFDIWEFPNNGVDSTNRTAAEMIARFDDNYQGVPLLEPQTVTYLSHPHWFDIFDSPKLREVFTHTGQYKFSEDNGPVIYTTLEGAYPTWASE